MPLKGSVQLPPTSTASRPSPSTPGKLFYNSDYEALQIDTGSKWISVGARDGSSYGSAADSAMAIKQLTGTSSDGIYWINVNNVPTQIYCDMSTSGGGWMHVSGAGTGNWFAGNTGADARWLNLNYSYGTYNPAAITDNSFWRNYSSQGCTEMLLRTGNKTYWIHISLSNIYHSPNGTSHQVTAIATSNNFPANATYAANTTVTIMHRTAQPEDPWINAGNVHGNGGDASGTDYMFWGENNTSNSSHSSWRVANGGVTLFVR